MLLGLCHRWKGPARLRSSAPDPGEQVLSTGSDSHVSGCLKEKTDGYVLQLEGLRGLSALKYTKPLHRLTHWPVA